MEKLCSRSTLKKESSSKLRAYDKIVINGHFNAQSNFLTLALIHSKLFFVVDLNHKDKIEWSLPILAGTGVPLTMTSDMDKLIVAYDSNKVGVFDLVNKQLHSWTVKNITKYLLGCVELARFKVVEFNHFLCVRVL